MANLFVLWNIKEKRVEGIFESNADAVSAKRRVIAKSGTKHQSSTGKATTDGADLEVLTATKP